MKLTEREIGKCGHCGCKPWVKGGFPPCDDELCTFPYWEIDEDTVSRAALRANERKENEN